MLVALWWAVAAALPVPFAKEGVLHWVRNAG